MNYYPHHIGDFNNATRHLTRVERSLYRDLIDLYFDTEQPLPADDFDRLARRVLANSDEEKESLRSVLAEFFTLVNGAYHQSRCDEEILKYQGLKSNAVKAGKASAAARSNKKATPVERPLNKRPTNQEPRTKNQEPLNSVPDGTDGDTVKSPAEMTKAELWSTGKSLLAEQGMPKAQCGSFVGKLVSDHGDAIVIEAVRTTCVAQPADAAQYLKATCLHLAGKRQPVNKQEALEQRGQSVVDEWATQGVIDAAA